MNEIIKLIPEMKMGQELMECMGEYPDYLPEVREKSSAERLIALSDIYDIYIPSQMSVEIYYKLYMGLMRSLQKKSSIQAVHQQYENCKGVRGRKYQGGILGGSDSFSIIGASGIGKSSAVFRAVRLITEKEVIEMESPYLKIAPCIVVQCPFDSSVKGLLWEILRKVDEVLGSQYYHNAVRARATTDMLIGNVSQVALQHIGLLVVDEIQNVVNSRNGKQLVGMLTQLINNSGISICMVGTPESIVFFEQAMQLARRSLGLQYEAMEFDKDFIAICKVLWGYLYTKNSTTLTDSIIEWLYEHSGGNISILVALIHDAQEISILEGRDVLDMTALEQAYQKRLAMLHDYLEPSVRRKKQTSETKKKELITEMVDRKEIGSQEKTESVRMDMDGQEISLEELVADAKVRNLNIVEIFQKYFAVEEVGI